MARIEIYHDGEFWCARGVGQDIFTQAETIEDLYLNIQEAVSLHFEDLSADK
jgi:predicted RNase H-like HicB family nuclease